MQIEKINDCAEPNTKDDSLPTPNQEKEHSQELLMVVTWYLILTYGFDKFDQGALPAMMKYAVNDYHPEDCRQCMGFGEELTG